MNDKNRCIYSFKFKLRNLIYIELDVNEEIIARFFLILYKLQMKINVKNYIYLNI